MLSIKTYLEKQIEFFNLDLSPIDIPIDCFEITIKRVNAIMLATRSEQYGRKFVLDDVFHSDKWALFILILGRVLYAPPPSILLSCSKGDEYQKIATKLYLLNKMLHGLDIHPSRNIPYFLYMRHPLGTIIGKMQCEDYLVVYQGCTIGSNFGISSDEYPKMGRGVALMSHSKILGNCKIGSNVIFGANSMIIDCDIPSNSIVVGQYPNHRVLKNNHSVLDIFFRL